MKTENIRVELSEEELERTAQDLASKEKDLSEAESRLEAASEAWKATRKNLREEVETARAAVHDVAVVYRDKAVMREVEVDERVISGVVHVFRVDTGATIRTRPIESDHQFNINDAEASEDEGEDL